MNSIIFIKLANSRQFRARFYRPNATPKRQTMIIKNGDWSISTENDREYPPLEENDEMDIHDNKIVTRNM